MTYLKQMQSGVFVLAFVGAVAAAAYLLVTHRPTAKTTDKALPPAPVDQVVKEEDFNTVTLTELAEKRIGLTIHHVEKKNVRRIRIYGGEVTVPAGHSILVAAPLGGSLKAPASGERNVGQSVQAGEPIFLLTPLLTPDGQATLSASLAEADGQVENAKTQLELARIALDRAQRVFKEGAGSQRQVDEAQAAFDLATKTLDAVRARQAILKKVVGDAESGTAAPISIDAPVDGLLRNILALPGQTVPSGAALFEVVDLSTVWVRVPLPVGDMDAIDRAEPAQVGKLSATPGTRLPLAKPIAAPPSANPLSATIDVYYEMSNTDGKLIPGQRLGVTIPLLDCGESLSVPWSAVVFDIHGGTWVYEQIPPHRYTRRRVVVSHTHESEAILAEGPLVGAPIVSAGAQELFGAETGFVK